MPIRVGLGLLDDSSNISSWFHDGIISIYTLDDHALVTADWTVLPAGATSCVWVGNAVLDLRLRNRLAIILEFWLYLFL